MDARQFGQIARQLAIESSLSNEETGVMRLQLDITDAMILLRQVIDSVPATQKTWGYNGMTALLEATGDGEIVAGGTWTKEQWLSIQQAFGALSAFLNASMTEDEDGPTPESVVYQTLFNQ